MSGVVTRVKITMSSALGSLSEKLCSAVKGMVGGVQAEVTSELEQIKRERDEHKVRAEELLRLNADLKTQQQDLVDKYTREMRDIEQVLEGITGENGELKRELQKEKDMKEQLVTEYIQLFNLHKRHTDLLKATRAKQSFKTEEGQVGNSLEGKRRMNGEGTEVEANQRLGKKGKK